MTNAQVSEKEPISTQDQREIADIYQKLTASGAKLAGPDGRTDILPNNCYSFLLKLLAELKAGSSVTILQGNAELTTVEASKLLGVSRQYLVELLQSHKMPFHMVGTHRRVYARDVLRFKVKRDYARRVALDDLAKQEFNEGSYEKIPDDFNSRQ